MLKAVVDTVFPRTCLCCKEKLGDWQQDDFVCRKCISKIKKNLPPFCSSCGRHLDKKDFSKNICNSCAKNRLHFDRAFAPCVYDGVIKELIHEFKYRDKDYLGKSLAKIMADFIKTYELPLDCVDYIVPVPLHDTRLREREFNQAEVLSRHICEEFDKDLITGIIRRSRYTKTQTELNPDERLLNVKQSFHTTGDLSGKNVLLVDDVLTTGATSSEAAHALKSAGANIVFVLTLAN